MDILPSFDTLHLVIPTDDPHLLTKFHPSQTTDRYWVQGSNIEQTEFIIPYLWPMRDWDSIPSHYTPPRFAIEGQNIRLSFSLPKFYFGHSARMASDYWPALEAWREFLIADCGVQGVKPVEKWHFTRIDFCWNFKMDTPGQVKEAINQLSRMQYRGTGGQYKRGIDGCYWPGSHRTLKFYCKGTEMNRHKKDFPEGFVQSRFYELSSILRYEEQARHHELTKLLGVDRLFNCTVAKMDEFILNGGINKIWDRFHSQFIRYMPIESITDIFSSIDLLRKPRPLRQFVLDILEYGVKEVKCNYPKSTFYTNRSILRDMGFSLENIETGFDKGGRSVDIRDYCNYDNFCDTFDNTQCVSDPLHQMVSQYIDFELSDIKTVL